MKIIAHRGYWREEKEKNSLLAISSGMDYFDGVETDIRDLNKRLVISHDIPSTDAIALERILSIHAKTKKTLAINIKADGLSDLLMGLLAKYDIDNYFTFDMSVPEMVVYKKKGIKFYTSLSEVIRNTMLLSQSSGIWLDSFYSMWYTKNDLYALANYNLPICVVSEELHGRNHRNQWNLLADFEKTCNVNLAICTDFPKQAKDFFHGNSGCTF